MSNGDYTLLSYSGSLAGGPSSLVLAAGVLGSRQNGTFDYHQSGKVVLDVTGNPFTLTWVGGTAGGYANTWNQNVAANTVWSGGNYAASGDLLTFDATAGTANTNVTLAGSAA